MKANKTFFKNKNAGSICLNAIVCLLCINLVYLQRCEAQDKPGYKTVVAGAEYKKSSFGQSMWGKHYRNEWITPVSVKIAMLDTLSGGLTPYEIVGNRQTKSVKLRDKNNREYILRSIDKSFTGAISKVAQGSFIETIANDQVSISHPYAAVTIPPLAEASKVYHTNPQIYYIPKQKALGLFNDAIGDNVYLFEQRPAENWETAPNFGNPKNIRSTHNFMEELLKDNNNQVDQFAFARARLFDMFIGDWGRHEDQWRWAEFKNDKTTIYKPIPCDRDQAFTKFDGTLLKAVKGMASPHLESFSGDIKRVNKFNYPARNLDRHLLNELSLQQWRDIAADLQNSLSDAIIDDALKLLPPEVYSFSGPEIAAKLKSRRNHLIEYAETYYKVLARAVDVTGSKKQEFFEVRRLNDDATEVNIYKLADKSEKKAKPFYSRIFHKSETFEIRLYGIGGDDEYNVTGDIKHSISVRLIGGDGKDKFTDVSHVKGIGHKTEIYDNGENEFKKTSETALHLSSDSAVHEFKYASYKFDKKGFVPIVLYNNDDRIYVGLSYVVTKNKWRKEPYGYKQYFDVKYSLLQNAFSGTYKSTFTKLLGKWDGVFYANYDYIRWTNFYGLGNETALEDKDRNYNRVRSHTYLASIGVQRILKGKHKLFFNGFYQGVDILRDTSRYIAKTNYNNLEDTYNNKGFAGLNAGYVYQKLNDSILPTKGIGVLATLNYTYSFSNNLKSFGRFGLETNGYLPFTKNLGVLVRAGVYAVTSTPDFFQYAQIGSSESLRGYRRERFYGNTAVFNQNELRWISNVHSYIYNGKIGFFALYDIGRVWLKGENANTLHHAYGAGIILSPYNKVTLSASYAVSPEEANIHLRLFKVF